MGRKVLWFSRHTMTDDQLNDLKRIYGKDIVINQINKTISTALELKDEIAENDVIAIVAPLSLQQEFLVLAKNKPVISCRNKRVLVEDGSGREQKVKFVFDGWYRIRKIEVVTEEL